MNDFKVAIKELQDYKQLDEEGIMVEVSRQAVEEVLEYIRLLEQQIDYRNND